MTEGKLIKYNPDEEHFLRKIAGAVIVHWDKLSDELQELLVQQAADMLDRESMVQADFQIKEFISAHKGGD